MASPLATEKIVRAALQALQRGGFLSSSADVAALESVPNNASDADISAILDTISFGGVPAATSVIRSDEDVDVFIDADDDDEPFLGPLRYFRVSANQADPPTTDPDNELFTVSQGSTSVTQETSVAVFGPRLALATGNHPAVLNIGTSASVHYGSIIGAAGEVVGGDDGLSIRARGEMDLRTDTDVRYGDLLGNNLRGGWDGLGSTSSFNVGDYTTPDSLSIETTPYGGGNYFTIRPTATDPGGRRLYIHGSNPASDYRMQMLVGGKYGETWGDPNNFGNAYLSVVGDDNSTTANAMFVFDRKTNRSSGTDVVTIKSSTSATTTYYLLSAFVNTNPVFRVDGSGNITIDGAVSSPATDMAEWVVADKDYPAGTVLVMRGGVCTASDSYDDPAVVGAVSTKPAALYGRAVDPFSVPLAFLGQVPVMCSNKRGIIEGNGELLVSGPNGCAVLAPENPKPGTIIGKAIGTMKGVKGLVNTLVNLQ